MFKVVFISLALLIASTNAVSLRHQEESLPDLGNNDKAKAADSFFRQSVPNIKDAQLTSWDESGDKYKFQYMNTNAPLTITQVQSKLVDDNKPYKFQLLETIQSVSGPLENGRMTTSVRTYGIESFDKAKENLDWD